MSVPHEAVRALTLEQVKLAITSQMTTDVMELSLVGDFEMAEAERLVLQYLATAAALEAASAAVTWGAEADVDVPLQTGTVPSRHIDVYLQDSDDRAVAYVAGTAPNRWGVLRGGKTVRAMMRELDPASDRAAAPRRRHPLFAAVALALLKEVINRRLFSTVREQKRLTYDANFHLTSFERLRGSWYLVTVTANPANAQAALAACQETLRDMAGSLPITYDNVESAKRVLINRHENDLRTNQYWADLMTGLQAECVPSKDASCIRDYAEVVESVTAADLQLLLRALG
ncbi:unnamed protein product, partial [Phaeothamnion confervicola]